MNGPFAAALAAEAIVVLAIFAAAIIVIQTAGWF